MHTQDGWKTAKRWNEDGKNGRSEQRVGKERDAEKVNRFNDERLADDQHANTHSTKPLLNCKESQACSCHFE